MGLHNCNSFASDRRASAFGKMSSMFPRSRHLIILSSLILTFIPSCTSQSASGLILAPNNLGTLTPTPFQPEPGVYDSPFSARVDPQPAATFTPYPIAPVYQNGVSNPEVLPPDNEVNPLFTVITNPLTGLPAADPQLLERRPIAIKIANYPRYVRPQSGLALADVVFEYYIEGLLTRFIAIFYGNDTPWAGPVRSGRYFDEHILRMYQSFFVFKFADPRELDYFRASDFADFLVTPGFGACPPYKQGKYKRESYNNIFFDTGRFKDCIARLGVDNTRPALRSGFFSELPQNSALTYHRIFTHYSVDDYNYWEYDPATHKYFRFQEATDTRDGGQPAYAPLMDDYAGLPVTADSVVVLFVPHTFTTQNEAKDEIYHIDLLNSGQAYVFRDGQAYPALWFRNNLDQPLLLTDLNRLPIYLKPGRTFYQVIGMSSTYSQSGTDWYFTFKTP
jgi:hypothetical protein